MIKLILLPYCNDCVGFESVSERPMETSAYNGAPRLSNDVHVSCKYYKRCKHIADQILKKTMEEENNV